VPLDLWHRIVDTNVNGTFHMARAAIPVLLRQGWGRIVNLSTGMRTMVKIGFSPYGPSKAAVEAMTAIWAQDLAGTGVTVNALLPGWVSDTDMVLKEDFPDRARLVPPASMIAPAVWLASEASNGVTGMRIIARDWGASLPAEEAFKAAAAKAGW
jgi:3-oxoacyl-[acyl-carrier protein] reductase